MKNRWLLTGVLCVLAPAAAFADILALQTFGFAGGRVVRYDELSGAPISGWSFNPQAVNPFIGQLSGLEVHNGVGYVSSLDTGQIFQFNVATGAPIAGGVFATVPIEPGDPRLAEDPQATANPSALRVGPDGLLYVADGFGSSVLRYNLQTGALVDRFVQNLPGVGGLGFSIGGSLLSTSNTFGAGPNAIYTGGGAPPTVLTPGAASQLIAPNSILVNPNGSFLVTDIFADYIFRYGADGAFQGPFAEIPNPADVDEMNLPPGATINSNFPSDMRFDAEGNILVVTLGVSSTVQGASKNYGSILRFAPDGTLIQRLADGVFAPSALALVPGLDDKPGDFNNNGFVNTSDYFAWRASFGRMVTPGSSSDGNFDGVIDAADYTIWRDNFVQLVGVQGSAVPEPASVLLACLAMGVVAASRVGVRCRRAC